MSKKNNSPLLIRYTVPLSDARAMLREELCDMINNAEQLGDQQLVHDVRVLMLCDGAPPVTKEQKQKLVSFLRLPKDFQKVFVEGGFIFNRSFFQKNKKSIVQRLNPELMLVLRNLSLCSVKKELDKLFNQVVHNTT